MTATNVETTTANPPVVAPTTAAVLERYTSSASPSARVLLTTIFGDALLPRDEAVPVGAIIELAAPLGINERNVRTTLQRLSSERLVTATRVGRRSFYEVHPEARTTFAAANHRIYQRPRVSWDGRWTIAVLDPDRDDEARTDLLQRLGWLGLAPAAPGVLASALVSPEEVAAAVAEGSGAAGILALTRGPLTTGTLLDDEGRRRFFDPDGQLDERYRSHLDTFASARLTVPTPLDAFVLRTLVVDSWRRLALRATDIPGELEPDGWPAGAAFDLTAAVLADVRTASEAHLDAVLAA